MLRVVVQAIWWLWWGMMWSRSEKRLRTLSAQQRDRILADRAAKVLRFHMKRAGTIRACDPYAKPMALDVDDPQTAMLGIERARWVLQRHSLPGHLLNGLLRQFDPQTKSQAAAQPEYQKPPAVAVGSSAT